jgi:hypothetical protein
MQPLGDLAKLDNLIRLPFRNGSGSVLLEASGQSLTEIREVLAKSRVVISGAFHKGQERGRWRFTESSLDLPPGLPDVEIRFSA